MKRCATILMATLFAITLSFSCAFAAPQSGDQSGTTSLECATLSGNNTNTNNQTWNWASPVYSYLTATDDGYMRVQGFSNRGDFSVVYYDEDFTIVQRQDIAAELPIFGGFYAAGNYYYIVSGQKNEEENNDTEVFRITKYDRSWNRIGACGIEGANTTVPFDGGSCRMTNSGSTLIIRTCHEMYTHTDGLNHQANVMIVVDTDSMSITDSRTAIGDSSNGYVSHSFNQFTVMDGNTVIGVDHGDAHPRGVCLNKYSLGRVTSSGAVVVFPIQGETGDNNTGVSVGGLQVSNSNYLIAGNSVKQDANFDTYKTKNIFVAGVNKTTNETTVHWLTDIAEGSGTAGTPQLVKLSSNQYMVLWYQDSKVNYVTIDGTGTATSETYTIDGNLSDCVPIVKDGKVTWYTWKNEKESLYRIPVNALNNPSVIEKTRGHLYELANVENGLATLVCSRCGDSKTGRVPTSCTIYWNWDPSDQYYYMNLPETLDVGTTAEYWVYSKEFSAESENTYDDFSASVEPSSGCIISGEKITFNKTGNYTISLFPTYNPSLKETYNVRVVKTLESVTLTPQPSGQQVFGNSVTLHASPDGGKGTLKYTFIQIDGAGNAKNLAQDITTPQYTWIAPAAGSYRLKVQAKDSGDSNRTVTSEEVDYTITRAPHPTVMPKQQYTVPFTVSQVSNDIISDAAGWTFDEEDLGSELAEGETAQFTAHYIGADAGNFENLDAEIRVKRAECTHGLANMVAHSATSFTCEEDGNDPYWQCSLCKRYFGDEDAQNEIQEGSWIISAHHILTEHDAAAATCEQPGNIQYWQCDVCNKYFSDESASQNGELEEKDVFENPIGHDWGEWQETDDVSTCIHAGQLVRVCNNDSSHKDYKEADLLAHEMNETAEKPATCEDTGNIHYWQCKNCLRYFTDADGIMQVGEADLVTPAIGHDYDRANGVVSVSATCTAPGEIIFICTHDSTHTITEPLSALGHNWDAGNITKASTATAEGVKTFTCTRCGATRTESLPARNNQVAADGTKVGPGASEEAANKAITGMKNDGDPAGSAFGLLKVRSAKQSNTSVTITWSKVNGAKKYVIYGNQCGKANKMKKLKTLAGSKFTVKTIVNNKGKKVKVKKGTYYKFIIVALDSNRNVVSTSKVIHVATKGGKVGNEKSVTTKAKKNKVTVKVGKTFALKAKTIPVSKKLKVKKHRGIAYESSNNSIATVSAKGIIKGKKKGTCDVYAYAQNGVCKKITVTVK